MGRYLRILVAFVATIAAFSALISPAAAAKPDKGGGRGGDAVIEVDFACGDRMIVVESVTAADGGDAHAMSNIVIVFADGLELRLEAPFVDVKDFDYTIDPADYGQDITAVYVKAGNNGRKGYGEKFDIDLDGTCDADGDGFDTDTNGGNDCNDSDAEINPDAAEVPYDGFDNDCSNGDLNDVDGDGHTADMAVGGTPDCNDTDPAINPGAVEIDDNDVDENCDGIIGVTDTANGCTIAGVFVETVASQPECDALVDLFVATDGPGWRRGGSWGLPTDPCGWYGVGCSPDGVISVKALGISGHVPESISDLVLLETLSLGGRFGVAGSPGVMSLPDSIGDLDSLVLLSILSYYANPSMSTVTPAIGGLESLETLRLSGLWLTELPPEIGQLTNLVELWLKGNRLTSLPPELVNLQLLEVVDLGRLGCCSGWNRLTEIPQWMGSLPNLRELRMTDNLLKGDITEEVRELMDTVSVIALADRYVSRFVIGAQTYTSGGNNCLTVTDPTVRAWLDARTPGWDHCQTGL